MTDPLPPTVPRATPARQAATLAVATLAGLVAWRVGLPLPWMLGPLILTTALSVAGAPLASPARLRPLMMPVIGVLLGSRISREVMGQIVDWWPVVALLVPFLAVTAGLSYLFYRRIGGFDPVTAFFSAMPGGLTDMILLGNEAGGDERRIALAHATRILVVICGIVLFFGVVFGVTSTSGGAGWVPFAALSWLDAAVLVACAVLGVPLGRLLHLPARVIMGPMLLSGAVHVAHIVAVPPPSLAVIAAQIVIGTTIGCRFLGTAAREVGRDMALGVGSSILMMLSALAFALIGFRLGGIDLAQLFLAYAPGGMTEMSLLALAMGQDVAFVTVLHLARITLVVFAAAPLFRLVLRRR